MRSSIQTPRSWLKTLLVAAPLAYLWWRLIDHLHVEWNLNPQYGYGWAVPFLCAYLLWQRLRADQAFSNPQPSTLNLQLPRKSLLSAFLTSALAFCYFPIRLVEEANPEWRLISWSLALVVIGLTLALFRSLLSSLYQVSHFIHQPSVPIPISAFCFPLFFFLVAVPWPTFIEAPLYKASRRAMRQ